VLSLTSIDSLKLNLDKALQPILHFFARMSAQPQDAFEAARLPGNAGSC